MKPARAAILLLLSFVVVNAQGQAKSADSWAGRYEREASLGRTLGGIAVFVNYVITVSSGNSELAAVIKAAGYQTDDEIRCDTRTQGDRVNLYFNSYLDGGGVNQYGVRVFKKGDLLLSLERTSYRNKYRARRGKYSVGLTKTALFIKSNEHPKDHRSGPHE